MTQPIEPHKEAMSRLATAECYLAALRIIVTSQTRSQENTVLTTLPANMLAGFCLELLLKGFLLLKGESSQSVRNMGHKIDRLIEAANSIGLHHVDRLSDLTTTLGKGHADFTYRYIDAGDVIDVFD